MMRVVGAVLCGGRSSRMGTDKSLLEVDGVPMARRVADALLAGGCSRVIAVGGDEAALSALDLAVVPDRWPGEGPVGGVLTSLMAFEEDVDVDAVVVVACDLPFLSAATAASLIQALDQHPAADAAAAVSDRIEPLCAVWRRTASSEVVAARTEGEHRLHAVLARLQMVEVPVDRQDVRNMNAPHDLPTRLSPHAHPRNHRR